MLDQTTPYTQSRGFKVLHITYLALILSSLTLTTLAMEKPHLLEPKNNQCNSQFFMPDGSCQSTCEFPFVPHSSGETNLCEPICPGTRKLSLKGSCVDDCLDGEKFPNSKEEKISQKVCLKICQEEHYFDPYSRKCKRECPEDMIAKQYQDIRICQKELRIGNNSQQRGNIRQMTSSMNSIFSSSTGFDLDQSQKDYCDTMSKILKLAGQVAAGGLVFASLVSKDVTFSVIYLLCGKLIFSTRYLSWKSSGHMLLYMMWKVDEGIGIDFGMSRPSSLSSTATSNTDIPSNFLQFNLQENFAYNGWEFCNAIAVYLLLGIISWILGAIFKNSTKKGVGLVCKGLSQFFKWGLIILAIFGSIDQIIIFGSIQLRNINFDTTEQIVGIALCALFLLSVLGILSLLTYVVSNLYKIKKQAHQIISTAYEKNEKLPQFKKKWASLSLFYHGYKETSFLKQYYGVIVIIVIGIIPNVLIAILQEETLMVSGGIIALIAINFIYLIIVKPMISIFNMVESIVYQSILLIFYVGVLLLNQLSTTQDTIKLISDTILFYALIVYYFIGCLFFLIHLIKGTMAGIASYKRLKQEAQNPTKIQLIGSLFVVEEPDNTTVVPIRTLSRKRGGSSLFEIGSPSKAPMIKQGLEEAALRNNGEAQTMMELKRSDTGGPLGSETVLEKRPKRIGYLRSQTLLGKQLSGEDNGGSRGLLLEPNSRNEVEKNAKSTLFDFNENNSPTLFKTPPKSLVALELETNVGQESDELRKEKKSLQMQYLETPDQKLRKSKRESSIIKRGSVKDRSSLLVLDVGQTTDQSDARQESPLASAASSSKKLLRKKKKVSINDSNQPDDDIPMNLKLDGKKYENKYEDIYDINED